MSRQQIIDGVLQQLDTMFADRSGFNLLGQTTPDSVNEEGINFKFPATSTYLDTYIFDWAKQPYIKGGHR